VAGTLREEQVRRRVVRAIALGQRAALRGGGEALAAQAL
jgi:hypothetical protein